MDKKYFTIGEISRIKGITKKALRFYEKIGLLEPHHVDPENGYRHYSWKQFVSMDIIKAMRVLDIGPHDIRAVMDARDTGALLEFLEREKKRAAGRIEELRKTIDSIEDVGKSIRASRDAMSHRGVYRRNIPRRHVVTLPFEGIQDAEDAALEYSKLDGLIRERGLTNTYGTGILFEESGGIFTPSTIYNSVGIADGSDTSGISVIPAGEYVCIWYTEKNAAEGGGEITAYCGRHGLTPVLAVQADLLNDVFASETPAVELQLLVRPDP